MAFCKCNKPIVQIFVASGRIPSCRPIGAGLSLSKIPFGAFRQGFAVCRAHSLCAAGAQLAHLQPEMYFLPGTRPGRKWISLCFPLLRQIRFFYTLRRSAGTAPVGSHFFGLFQSVVSKRRMVWMSVCDTGSPPKLLRYRRSTAGRSRPAASASRRVSSVSQKAANFSDWLSVSFGSPRLQALAYSA